MITVEAIVVLCLLVVWPSAAASDWLTFAYVEGTLAGRYVVCRRSITTQRAGDVAVQEACGPPYGLSFRRALDTTSRAQKKIDHSNPG